MRHASINITLLRSEETVTDETAEKCRIFNPFETIRREQSRTLVAPKTSFDLCSILTIPTRGHDPVINYAIEIDVAGHVDYLFRFPVAHVEGVRDDARAGF